MSVTGPFSTDSTSFACQLISASPPIADSSLELNQHLRLAAVGEAAVDGDDRAARIRGKIGGQEDDHRGDLVGDRRPAEGHLGEGFPAAGFGPEAAMIHTGSISHPSAADHSEQLRR
jgi:hypothetical protein